MGRGILHWLLGVPRDRRAILILALASIVSTAAFAETLSPEADACKASGLIALKQRSPQVKDIEIDLDSAKIINADTKIEDVPIKTVVIGEAYIERAKSAKPQTFVCIIGASDALLRQVSHCRGRGAASHFSLRSGTPAHLTALLCQIPTEEEDMDVVRETSSLIAADKVQGTWVYNAAGENLGSIHDLMIDKKSGNVAYAIMSFGGFVGIGNDYHPLPWSVLRYDTALGGYVVNLDRAQLEGAPSYAEDAEPEWGDREYERKIHDYYGVGAYWGPPP